MRSVVVAAAAAIVAATSLGGAAPARGGAGAPRGGRGGGAARAGGGPVVSAAFALGSPSPIASLHPLLTSNSFAEQNGIGLLFLPLLWFDSHFAIDWSKSIASAVVANADDTSFTVTLRSWHWSDGKPVTSADVLYSWTLIQALGPSFYAWDIGGVPQLIRSVTAPDARTVVFTLRQRVNPDWFEKLSLDDFYPLPRQEWARYSVSEQQSLQSEASFYGVVDGPFRLQSLRLGRDATFVANDRYDGARPHVRRLVVDFLEGADPIERLEAGQIDVVNFPYDLWTAADRLPGVKRVSLGAQGNIYSIVLNFRNASSGFLRDLPVRQAIARAIDQQRLIDTVFHGQGQRQEGFVATGEAAEIPPELRGGGGPLPFDSAAARALLDRDGYRVGAGGLRSKGGRALSFTLLVAADVPTAILMAQLIQSDLRAVGIDVSIKELEFNQLVARMLGTHDGWDAVLIAWGSGNYPDGTQWFSPTSSGNYGGYDDPTMNRLLADATTHGGDGPLFALERYALLQQPMIFLPGGDTIVLARDGVHGLHAAPGPSGELNGEALSGGGPRDCEKPGA